MREFEYLTDGGASVEGEGHGFAPWGFDGGAGGKPAELRLEAAAGGVRALPSKVPYMRIAKGDRFRCVGPAGGGYGYPMARDPQAVLDDVLDGLIPVETAERDYGVAIAGMQVDIAATGRRRGG